MDVTTCLKSLLLSIQQYSDTRTPTNAAGIQKQVEVVSGLRCEQLLSSGQVLPSECVSGLVELAGNPNTCPALTSSIISLLGQLACDDDSRKMLNSSYSLTSTLAYVIHCHRATPCEPLVLQCLQVLQKLTYNTRVFLTSNYIRELVSFLMTNIQSRSEDIIMPCLSLMANLCRDNQSVQSHIKSLDTLMLFYRTLLSFLSHNSLTVVVFTLSILASLTLNEKVGEKVFDAKNIHQTFQLVFNIIVNGDGTLTRKYSVDLLVDLLKNPKIADFLTRYKHFSACVSQVLGLLQSKDPDSAAKVLELLLAMCSISGLRSRLCEEVFSRPAGPRCRAVNSIQAAGLDVAHKAESGLVLVQWLSSPVEGAESCSLQALQLLKELLEALRENSPYDCVLSFVEVLLPVLLRLLKSLDPAKGDAELRKHCHRITRVTALLLNILYLSVSVHSAAYVNNCVFVHLFSQVCAEALLKVLEVMSKLRNEVKDMETSFYRMLEEQMVVSALSLALTSHRRDHVQTGLSLLFDSTALPDFPSLLLGERIAANNAYRRREAELPFKCVAVQKVPPPRTNTSTMDSSSGSSRSVCSLAEKMHSGLEFQEQGKDSQLSEIIDVYEQKLSAFACKESRLQDLLEAKALALSQADRLIGQYRLQQAQAEAETRKLSCLLKEAERQREELQSKLNNQLQEVEHFQADMENMMQRIARLQQDFDEHQTLKRTYNALLSRFNESERGLKELQATHVSLTKQHDTLTKKHEELQQQHKHAEEEKVKEQDQKNLDLEETLEVLRKELSKTEQARKSASIKVSSLEQQKNQLETKLKQKEEELNKLSTMIGMIHSLSSGKLKNDVNLSL
uniref:Cellular inhibitor of PP2A n=1 Tax=Mastacembelus armatus TaxID=205130 RepID=A0A3Q3MLQ0_9TELE